jgi:hypothetical protein
MLLLSLPPTAPLVLQVNATALCAWLVATNASIPAANAFGAFCDSTLQPTQQQTLTLGRCLTAPRYKLEV